jgi:GNAT superfamily N-acetyltransferase
VTQALPVAVRWVAPTDPSAMPLLAALRVEYDERYGDGEGEMSAYPPGDFVPPHGGLLVLQLDGTTVAGGAFRRHDAETAELKRIWTAGSHRRRGLARRVLAELEAEIARRGYRRIRLTTGPRQPEAVALYAASGYAVLPDDPGPWRLHHFGKDLQERGTSGGRAGPEPG